MSHHPTVSVVINNYNYGRYLRECVDSALRQTERCQVVVVDDGSTDASLDILATFGDSVDVVAQPNGGQAAAINAGVERATGDIVALLDADDVMAPTRVEVVARAFAEHPEATWLRHNMTLIDAAGVVSKSAMYPTDRVTDPLADITAFGDTFGTTSGLCLRRELLGAIGPVPPGPYRYYADHYLIYAATLLGRCWTVTQSLCLRRQHPQQITNGRARPAPGHVRQLLEMREDLASVAARLAARRGGPEQLRGRRTWWQRKASLQAARLSEQGPRAVLVAWCRYVVSLVDGPLPLHDKLAFLVRDSAVALVPSRYYESAWWLTHDGRTVLNRGTRSDAAASTPTTSGQVSAA